ncbi:MAG: DUF2608 domain-containing protein [Xanthomonadales bacterium]|nr:DUF2608 domain-containing protein [Xanthomonadales bacterium]
MNTIPRITAPLALVLTLLALAGCAATGTAPGSSGLPTGVTVEESTDIATVAEAAAQFRNSLPASQVLVVFDLDNTLLAMNSELGADQWYDWQKKLESATPCDARVVADRLAVQGALFFAGAMHLTDDRIPGLIDELVEAGHPVMVLTARGPDYHLSTFRELRRNKLDFRPSGPGRNGGFSEVLTLPGAQRGAWYQDGVMMVAGQHKGDMLEALYQHLRLSLPGAVVFADDKTKNVAAMEESLTRLEIPGFLLRYAGEDARVAAFDDEQAARQWRELKQPLIAVQEIMQGGHYQVPRQSGSPRCRSHQSKGFEQGGVPGDGTAADSGR